MHAEAYAKGFSTKRFFYKISLQVMPYQCAKNSIRAAIAEHNLFKYCLP